MTAAVTTPVPAARTRAVARARWRDLLGSEWIKLWSLRSTAVVLGCLVVVYVCLAYRAAATTYDAWPTMADWMKADPDPAHDAFDFPSFLLLEATVGTIGAMTVAGEYATGLIRTSLIAVPDRSRVMLAKVTVVAGVLTAVGLILSVAIWLVTFAVLSGRIDGLSFSTPGVLRGILGTTLLLPVCGLVGMAIASLIRNTAGTVFAVLAFFLVVPLAVRAPLPLLSDNLRTDMGKTLPAYAWGRLMIAARGHIVERVSSIPTAWISLIAWAIVAIVATVLLLRRRDA